MPPHETYEVTVDGRRAICKVATGPRADPATEARVMAFVARETPVPVPTVLAVGPDHFVAEWHPDVPQEATANESKARAMGAGLATLHEATAGAFDAPGTFAVEGDPADGALTVAERDDWHAVVRERLLDRRAFLASAGHADVADAVLDFLRAHPAAFDGAGDPVLCHGNFLPDHVGVDGDDLACVIDFEHALCGPAEYDCWRALLPISANEDASLADRFRAGYESVRSLPDGFDRRRDRYRVVLTVSYLKALYLQNPDDAATRERAERLREFAFDRLDDLERTA